MMKHKKHKTNDKKIQGQTPEVEVHFFSPEVQAEIDRLTDQKDEGLTPFAFSRLQQIRAEQQPQVDRNKKVESWRVKNQNRYIKVAIAIGGVGSIGYIADKPNLLTGALVGSLLNIGLHAKWVLAQAVGYDYVPFKGAEQRAEYLDSILHTHPGQPQTGLEEQS